MNIFAWERRHPVGAWRCVSQKPPARYRRSRCGKAFPWFLGILAISLTTTGPAATATNDLSEAVIQGRQLARQLCEAQPAENFTNSGVLTIQDAKGRNSEIPVNCEVIVTPTNWQSIYDIRRINTNETHAAWETLIVTHSGNGPNRYQFHKVFLKSEIFGPVNTNLSGEQTMIPFADSDFWIADLGLEFFHWPEQKILKHEMRRGRACKVLESTNPHPSPNGYSRVVSWIDNETLGLVQAEAYDAKGKLLKEFYPKSFKKVNGQWELQEMEIRNDQTGSRTRLEFNTHQSD